MKKPEYYIVWIEGLTPKTGEKVHKLLPEHPSYKITTRMTEAMRVLPEDREKVKSILKERGVASWSLENCMVKTNYAPKGTIFIPFSL